MIAGARSFVNIDMKSAAFGGGWRGICCTPINRRAGRVTTAGLLRPYGKAMVPAGCHRAHARCHCGRSGAHNAVHAAPHGPSRERRPPEPRPNRFPRRSLKGAPPAHRDRSDRSEFCCKIPRQVKQRRKQWPLPEGNCANLWINIQTGPDAKNSASGPKRSVNTWFSCCHGFRQRHR